MPVLTSLQRKALEDACVKGRRASEHAVRAALTPLAVTAERPPAHLSEGDRQFRRGLRAKARQLGDTGDRLDLLIAECAYEQWHRLLFARFLAENNLLIHPEYGAPVTLEDCDALAESLGEPDGWAVAGRFAAEILPGIFRLDDPCVQLRLAPEGRLELESIVAGLPAEIFTGHDSLGWVYQFWQREQKDEVNRSERKIGGANIAPVTQLFTENYMVRFLLENSLGAWWAARHPNSPLINEWEFLRFDNKGNPVAGSFDTWPAQVSDVTLMDPCCGSGHFLVEAFRMLWRMRAEEEGLDPIAAQDAVLRDNLFGLEIDPRCVQIAMFSLALISWKDGAGWRGLPVPNLACSGVSTNAPAGEWAALAAEDSQLGNALMRLHILFRDAQTLGSLIDPKRALEISDPSGLQGSFDDVAWDQVAPILAKATSKELGDPATAVLGADAVGIARAADYLSRRYVLIATNVPYLTRKSMDSRLVSYCDRLYSRCKGDLATVFLERSSELAARGGSFALVTTQNWLSLSSYREMREWLLAGKDWNFVATLGAGAFAAISGEVVQPVLTIHSNSNSVDGFPSLDCYASGGVAGKRASLASGTPLNLSRREQLAHPDSRIVLATIAQGILLSKLADGIHGLGTKDSPRFLRFFWEPNPNDADWEPLQDTVRETVAWGGAEQVVFWQKGRGVLAELGKTGAAILAGSSAYGRSGVLVSQMGDLPCTLYRGGHFFKNAAVISPHDPNLTPAIWAFCQSPEFAYQVRLLDRKMNVTNSTLVKVPFDVDRWRAVAAEVGPLPEPSSDDPTQWLFNGRPESATEPLQVGVARLLSYGWPQQVDSDELSELADGDGIVCLPSVRGERIAADRLQELLACAFGATWSPARSLELLAASDSNKKGLDAWLRDDFFKEHCQVFKNRPFIWQIWDGRKDGFSALLNYHRLDRSTLEKLIYSYLGDWIERQTAGVRDDVAGAEERLAAARALRVKLELILEGEPPYDIFVRWKPLAEQPIGWEPDLNDGVRLNVRPFVEAGVLRAKFSVKWDKDRGTNPDGSERLNDRHHTHAEKRAARGSRS